MTYGINTFESGTADESAVDNTNILTGLTGGFTQVRSLAGTGTAKYDTAAPHRGSLAVRFDAPVATDIARIDTTGLSTTQAVLEPYVRLAAYPASESVLMQIRNATTSVAALAITAAGLCRLYDGGGTAVWLASSAIPLNQYVRYSLRASTGSATSSPFNGTLHFDYFAGANLETTTATETAVSFSGGTSPSAANTGITNITNLRVGKLGTSVAWSGVTVDDYQFDNASVAVIGPLTGALPINSYTATSRVFIDASSTSGTPTGQTLVQQSGPTVTISGPVSGVFTVTLPTPLASAAVVRLTSTNGAGSDIDDITINPSGASSTTIIRDVVYWNGTALT